MTTNDNVDMFTTLQKRLEEARTDKGVSIAEARAAIRKMTGLSNATMTHWWNGTAKEPRGAATVRAADYLGVNPLWLARGIGPKRPSGKGERTMPIPKGVHVDEEDLATMLRLWNQLSPRARAVWILHGQSLIELTSKKSLSNPYGNGERHGKPAPRARKTAKR